MENGKKKKTFRGKSRTSEEKKNKGGRPRRFATPEQMKEEIEAFFTKCEGDGHLPLISWIEYCMHFSFYDYERDSFPDRDKFSEVVTWAREASKAICEQAAFTGRMSKVATRLYLTCRCGYVNSYKVESDNTTKIEMDNVFTSLIGKVEAMSDEEKEIFKSKVEDAYEKGTEA